jgi:hypothetical protein
MCLVIMSVRLSVCPFVHASQVAYSGEERKRESRHDL